MKRKNKHVKKNFKPFIISVIFVICAVVILLGKRSMNETADIRLIDDNAQVESLTQQDKVSTPTDAPTAAPTAAPTPQQIRRGTSEPIPEQIQLSMQGKSMKNNNNITFDDLRYLTIPHYDFNYNITTGHLVVAASLAEEVLDIFAELFDAKYPIERMELIDKYDANDFTSIEYNNTSAFNYRQVSTGTGKLSNHAFGRAIDINPQQNPYVYSNGSGAHENAREFWKRDIAKWTREIDRAAYIGNDTQIYRIFKKRGWTWGGDWSPSKDYQHFEK